MAKGDTYIGSMSYLAPNRDPETQYDKLYIDVYMFTDSIMGPHQICIRYGSSPEEYASGHDVFSLLTSASVHKDPLSVAALWIVSQKMKVSFTLKKEK